MPSDPKTRAVYESQLAVYKARVANRTQNQNPNQNGDGDMRPGEMNPAAVNGEMNDEADDKGERIRIEERAPNCFTATPLSANRIHRGTPIMPERYATVLSPNWGRSARKVVFR